MTDREEWRIKQLEEETRHETAMRQLQGQRLDAHDASIGTVISTLASVASRLDSVAIRLDELTGRMNELAAMQAQTGKMLQDLIQAITRDHSNGKGQ
jgi:hypothetical protein